MNKVTLSTISCLIFPFFFINCSNTEERTSLITVNSLDSNKTTSISSTDSINTFKGKVYSKYLNEYTSLDIGKHFSSLEEAKNVDKEEVKWLQLTNCTWNHIPTEVFEFTKLERLDITTTYIEEIPDDITKLKNLKIITIQYCTDLKEITGRICELKKLRRIIIFHGKIRELPICIWDIDSLADIRIRENPISESEEFFANRMKLKEKMKTKWSLN